MDIKGKIEMLQGELDKTIKTQEQATVLVNKYQGAIEILQQLEIEEAEAEKEAKKANKKRK